MMEEKVSFFEPNSINIKFLLVLFFSIAAGEIIAEFFQENFFIYLFKPLLVPIITLLYWISSEKKNQKFLLAMFFAFLANVFFISKDFNSIIIGSTFFIVYRFFTVVIALKLVPLKNLKAIFLGSIPFISSLTYFGVLTINEIGLGVSLLMYGFQVLLMSFLGGFSLANYMMNDNKMNYWLLLHTVFFTLIQFIIILKIYYLELLLFQPLAMFLYVFAQYAWYKFMILAENNQKQLYNNLSSRS